MHQPEPRPETTLTAQDHIASNHGLRRARIGAAILACFSIFLLAACAPEGTTNPSRNAEQLTPTINSHGDEPFLTTGWALQPDALSPFADRIQTDPTTTNVDDNGIAEYQHYETGEKLYHPIYVAQHAMALIRDYQQTGNQVSLDLAAKNAQFLVDTRVERDGAWFFQYEFDWTYVDRTLISPWWSGMAQGESLTLFSLLSQLQPDNPQWREAAEKVFKSFAVRGSGNEHPWVTVVIDGELWFEEYAGSQPPLQVLNGQVFAIFGLWEYWLISGDPLAARYIDGGASTVLTIMPRIRNAGGVSRYCAQLDYCESDAWLNGTYHPIHIQQLRALNRITGDERFSAWADLLVSDQDPEALRAS